MLAIFRPKKEDKRFETFSNQLAMAFAQIKTDIAELSSKIDSQQSNLDRINQWVSYLNRYGQNLSDSHAILSRKYEKINENHQKLHSSHQEVAQMHSKSIADLKERHEALQEQIRAHKAELRDSITTHIDGHKELTRREIDSLKAWLGNIHVGIDSERQKYEVVKRDVETAQQAWNRSYSALKEVVAGLKEENLALKKDLSQMGGSIADTRLAVETAKNLVKSHISSQKSESQHVQMPIMQSMAQPVSPSMMPPVAQVYPTSGFERHIISRVLPNRKSYVLKFIIDLAAENRFSTKEIESIVVDEKRLCGRTSFYGYLKELKYRGQIGTANIEERIIVVGTQSKPQQVQKTFDEIVDNLDKGQ